MRMSHHGLDDRFLSVISCRLHGGAASAPQFWRGARCDVSACPHPSAGASGDGALTSPVTRWDDTGFGAKTKFMSSGDFNGDGKDDLGLFYNYGPNSGHVAVFTLTAGASGDGTLASPVTHWDSTIFGANTAAMA